MAKMIEGVTENILKCAKEEFLANGYENASLRRKMLSKTPEMIGKRTENRAWENIVKERE